MREASLPIERPFHAASLLRYLALRLMPGVERIADGRYRRVLTLAGDTAVVDVDLEVAAREGRARVLTTARASHLPEVLRRVDWLIDAGQDSGAGEAVLATDPLLRPLVRGRPGLRIPGTMAPFEVAVRAIVGQQISVAAATTVTARIVGRWGRPVDTPVAGLTHAFPGAERLAAAPLEEMGLPRARAEAIRLLSAAVAGGELALDRDESKATIDRLLSIRGIGPWTACYVGLRALGLRDTLPVADLGLRQALNAGGDPLTPKAVAARSERWRPHRGLAAAHLWAEIAAGGG